VQAVFGIAALVVLVVIAYLATGRGGGLAPLPEEMTRLALPQRPLTPADLKDIRLGKIMGGYRVDHVHQLVDRMASDLAARDARISELERKLRLERIAKSAAPLPGRAVDPGRSGAGEIQSRAGPSDADERPDDSPVNPAGTATQ
jgi:hypothetical protein